MELSEQIHNIRKKRGFTQEALAQACDVSLPTIRSIEQGQRLPSIALLQTIAEVLSCELTITLKPRKT